MIPPEITYRRSLATFLKVAAALVAGEAGAALVMMGARPPASAGSALVYVAPLCVAIFVLASLLLVTLGAGYQWARLPLAALLWTFLAVQIVGLLIRGQANGMFRMGIGSVLVGVNAAGTLTLHSRAAIAAIKRSQSLRRRRFPPGFEWAFVTGLAALFGTAAVGSVFSNAIWLVLGLDDPIPRAARVGSAAFGGAIAVMTVVLIPRSRLPIYFLFIADFLIVLLNTIFVEHLTGSATAFGMIIGVLCAVGLFTASRQSLRRFLADRNPSGPSTGSGGK